MTFPLPGSGGSRQTNNSTKTTTPVKLVNAPTNQGSRSSLPNSISANQLNGNSTSSPLWADIASNSVPPQPQRAQEAAHEPNKKNAIILEDTKNFSQDQVLRAVADIIGGRNIIYITRLSSGRICIYLANEESTNKIVGESGITINDVFLPCRKYISEATKVVVSNCPPEMSDESLKKVLEPYGRVVSPPTRLRVSTNHDDLKHVLTWRRSVYVLFSHDAQEMPSRVSITNPTDGVKHTLYLDKDEKICGFCKIPGHLIEKCKKKQAHDRDFPDFNSNFQTSVLPSQRLFVHSLNPQVTSAESSENSKDVQNKNTAEQVRSILADIGNQTNLQTQKNGLENKSNQSSVNTGSMSDLSLFGSGINETQSLIDLSGDESNQELSTPTSKKQTGSKRALSLSPTSQADEDGYSSNSSSASNKSNPTKKMKKKNSEEIAKLLSTMKQKPSYVSTEVFQSFLEQCRGKANSRIVAQRLGISNISALIVQLNETAAACLNFNLQRRLERAANALINQDQND